MGSGQLTNRVGLDIAIDNFPGDWIHGNSTGTVHDTIGNDSLRVNPRQGFGGLIGEHGGLGSHLGKCEGRDEKRRKGSKGWAQVPFYKWMKASHAWGNDVVPRRGTFHVTPRWREGDRYSGRALAGLS